MFEGVVFIRYMVISEQGPTSYGAYVPDLPGCVAAGESQQEALQLIQEAIELHFEDLKESGQLIPEPHSSSSFVEVCA
jgi:predicted RNase H-like HicB family nuclease